MTTTNLTHRMNFSGFTLTSGKALRLATIRRLASTIEVAVFDDIPLHDASTSEYLPSLFDSSGGE